MKRPEELARRFLVLADRDIKAFRKNHLPIPPFREGIDLLGPFAVELRYDLIVTEPLDRAGAHTVVEAIRLWAERQVF